MTLPPLPPEDHVCAGCGVVDRDLEDLVHDFTSAVGQAPDVRRRPADGVWCVAEYACHVRDVLVTYTIRLHRARVEDEPVLEPMYNDLRARRFDYANADLTAVLAEARAASRGLAREIERTTDWDRRVRRLDEVRTARWLARQARHEVLHHTRDVSAVSSGSRRPAG